EAVNARLVEVGARETIYDLKHPERNLKDLGDDLARFVRDSDAIVGRILVNPKFAATADIWVLASAVYHEARHAEQDYLIHRHTPPPKGRPRAGPGQNPAAGCGHGRAPGRHPLVGGEIRIRPSPPPGGVYTAMGTRTGGRPRMGGAAAGPQQRRQPG